MATRRGGAVPLGAGPGRLCVALAIDDALYGHDLREPPLRLETGWSVPDEVVGVSRRVGVSAAVDWPYRFFVRAAPGLSRPEAWGSGGRRRGSRRDVRG